MASNAELGAENMKTVNGVSLYYEEHGTGAPILCIHGTGSSALVWSNAFGDLARRGRVIAYDRRGCTRSERPEPYDGTTAAEHAGDAAALLEVLGAAPAVIIGRSYGGEIAVELVQRYPDLVRALVLLEPAIVTLSAETLAWAKDLAARVRAVAAADGLAAAAESFYRAVLGDETWEGLPESIRQMVLDNAPAILAELNGVWSKPDAEALARVTCPVLLVSAESSPPAFRAVDEALWRMMPSARHEVVGGGHMIDPASPVILGFLEEVLSAT